MPFRQAHTLVQSNWQLEMRTSLLAVAVLGVVLYAAADHFATFAYVIPGDQWAAVYLLVYWLRDLLTVVGAYFAYRLLPDDVRPDLQWQPTNAFWYVGAAALGGLFFFLSEFIIRTYARFGIHGTNVLADFRHLSLPLSCLVLLEIGIISPIVQEVVFRGWLLSGLRRIASPAPAIVVSAAVFSLMHIRSGIPTLTHSFLFGILAGVLFLRSRSIVPPTILHIVVNSTGAIVWLTEFANR
jgi:membrane protease YdiL (CAAX protease family)